jgi:hypothetical protein
LAVDALKLIYCAGGNPTFARIAIEAGFLYGSRLPATVYGPVYFADQHYTKPDRAAYMRALAEHQPQMATVLDWERPEQLAEVLGWAEEAAQWCESVVIIPKVMGGIGQLPRAVGGKRVILGYSVPTSYGGTLLPIWEFSGWPIHLLGGSPQMQMRLWYQMGGCCEIVSADGNMANLQAHKGRFWAAQKSEKGHWRQLSSTGDTERRDANARAFALSCQNIAAEWRQITTRQGQWHSARR